MVIIWWLGIKYACMHKNEGGLGIKSSETMNKALLAKWWWKLLIKPDSLLDKVLEEYQSREGT